MADRRLERVEQLLPARWPTADEAARSRWFSPVRVGALTLHERTWVPAMVPWRATEQGEVTDHVVDWYRRFAMGQPGAIVVEATGIRDVPSGPLLRIGHDRYVTGLRRVVDAVREASGGRTKLFIQIIDFLRIRRRVAREAFLGRFLDVAPLRARWPGATDEHIRSALLQLDDAALERVLPARDFESYRQGFRERVTDTEQPHIRELPQVLPGLFADAAARAEAAGFDGVELHAAHAYTLAGFLSRLNTRTDGYGGTLAGRLRLPLEVIAAVRARASAGFAVGARFLGDEAIAGGTPVEDAAEIGVAFARAGLDFLSISKGGKFEDAKQPRVGEAAYPYTGPSGQECMPTVAIGPPGPFGRNVPLAAAVRAAVRAAGHQTPVVTAGGIASFDQAEAALAAGHADIVAAARQSLADPDWFKKLRLGRGAEVRRCLFTNYCEGLDQAHKEVTCQRWDREKAPDDATAPKSQDGRRRLVAPPWS